MQSNIPPVTTIAATVLASATTSNEINLQDQRLLAIDVPDNFDGTTITITAAGQPAGVFRTMQNSHSDSTAYTITTAASQRVPIDNVALTASLQNFKLVCGTSQSTSNTVFNLIVGGI